MRITFAENTAKPADSSKTDQPSEPTRRDLLRAAMGKPQNVISIGGTVLTAADIRACYEGGAGR